LSHPDAEVPPAKIEVVKVHSLLGEYPFEFRRLERRGGTLAIVGTLAGIEASVIVDRSDLRAAAKMLALPAALTVLAFGRHRAASRQSC
jgi:hypothetical protein